MTSNLFYETDLEDLLQKKLHRELRPVENAQGPRVRMGGRELLNFSSNDYLGLASDKRLADAACAAIQKWGTGSGASRLLSGSLQIHHELEEKIAAFKREEKALTFSSGFAANLGVIQAVLRPEDTIWIDRYSHASIVDAARLSGARLRVYPHRDLDFLEDRLGRERKPRDLIVTESYFSMDGDCANLAEMVRLAKRHKLMLMIDEAHATGVWGANGRGLTEHFGVEGQADIVMGTFSKALGSHGGFVASRTKLADYFINKSRTFIYTTAPSPASAAASLEAIRVCESDSALRTRLWANVRLIRTKLKEAEFALMDSDGPIIPIVFGETEYAVAFSKKLFEKGFLIPAIRPPTVPKGSDRLRITVTAKHTDEDIARLVTALREIRG